MERTAGTRPPGVSLALNPWLQSVIPIGMQRRDFAAKDGIAVEFKFLHHDLKAARSYVGSANRQSRDVVSLYSTRTSKSHRMQLGVVPRSRTRLHFASLSFDQVEEVLLHELMHSSLGPLSIDLLATTIHPTTCPSTRRPILLG
jgi:hypothetical protein